MRNWCGALLMAAVTLTACESKEQKQEKMVDVTTVLNSTDSKIAELTGAIEQSPNNPELYRRRALLYYDKKEYKDALADINRALELNPAKGEYYFQKARFLRSSGQVSQAFKAAQEAASREYKTAELYVLLGEMYFIVKEYQKAIDHLNEALKHSPFSEQAYYYKGLVYAESGDTSRAISNLQTSVEQEPEFSEGYNALVKIYTAQKDYATAQQYAESGLRFVPTDAFLWYNHALTLQNRYNPDSAISSYNKALFYDSTMHLANYNLGVIYLYQNKPEKAAEHLQRVVNQTQSLPQARTMLAQAYEQMGQNSKAREVYEQISQQNPNNAEATEALNRLRNKPDVQAPDTANRK